MRIAENHSEIHDVTTKNGQVPEKLRKYLTMAYEDTMKGVMDGKPFVLLCSQFKVCDQQEEVQKKIQA